MSVIGFWSLSLFIVVNEDIFCLHFSCHQPSLPWQRLYQDPVRSGPIFWASPKAKHSFSICIEIFFPMIISYLLQ